jgi:hypothetical protein
MDLSTVKKEVIDDDKLSDVKHDVNTGGSIEASTGDRYPEATNSADPSFESARAEIIVERVIMAVARSPPKLPVLHLDRDNLEEQFKLYKFVFNKNMEALKVKTDKKAARAGYFISDLPTEAQKIILDHNFATSGKSDEDIDDLISIIVEAKPKKTSKLMARFRFFARVMRPGESFESFWKEIRSLADRCGFGTLKDELLRDRLMQGHSDQKFQVKLLKLKDDVTLDEVIQWCRGYEDLRDATAEMGARNAEVHAVNKGRVAGRGQKQAAGRPPPAPNQPQPPHPQQGREQACYCRFCGTSHVWGWDQCPAAGKRCAHCGGKNNAAIACKKNTPNKKYKVDYLQEGERAQQYEEGDAVKESNDEVLRGQADAAPGQRP